LAKQSASANGRSQLEEAMALLIQNQASFLSDLREMERDRREMERDRREIERANSEHFLRIEATMTSILRVLDEHGRMLERLPEAVREKIGFRGQP
jgi:hypothetical protein